MEVIVSKSGAKVLYVPSEDDLSALSVWVLAGSRFDPVGKEGLSHFFEHLLMTRTQKHEQKRDRMLAL